MFNQVHPSMEKMDNRQFDNKNPNFNISQVLAVSQYSDKFVNQAGENSVPYQEHPSRFVSNIMSRRNKTSQKNRISNNLIYRRNEDKNSNQQVNHQRVNIDINDRFFYQR